MNKIEPIGRPLQAALAPVQDYLAELHARVSAVSGGNPADYIPELGKVDPELFGIAIATVDGQVYAVGDADVPFTIQSVSKPFMYGYALQHYGRPAVLEQVGVEPTGEAFNSIVLDEVANRPFNPMVNAGAIAVAEMMLGDTQEKRIANMLELFSDLAGRKLEIDDAVFNSELATGHRNRAIAYMMLNTAMISRDPNEVLDLYFRQCSVKVTARDLAIMAATLANDGKNPLTGKAVFDAQYVRDVLTVMNSCGMYDYAGEWAYEVGMPAKSGVSGCIIAVIPGQIGISVYSPPIDRQGNSVRGIRVCQEISNEFELHAFNNRTNVRSVIRRDYRADLVRSNRLRTPEERAVLAKEGARIAVIEAQGALFFGSTEQLLRRLMHLAAEARYVIVDFKRVHLADRSARKLIVRVARAMAQGETELVFAGIAENGPLESLIKALAESEDGRVQLFRDTDTALEWCEDRLLTGAPFDLGTKFAVSEINLFKGLSPAECRLIESIIRPLMFDKGDVIMREGDDAKLFFVLARGTVSVEIKVPGRGERRKRVASIGPGLTFGEMALLDGGKRSADIVANERVICYGLGVEELHALAAEHPNVMITILSNLTREFSERLRHANEEIGVLE
ncbi:glutaminase A [Methyloceanibacter sp.]|uniref:glutaminase A n=1 Tax=Methyloceanibacter sp. TaxID=1965321 RepID=UPI002D5BF91B|nr:glutaminase A [Methyloceanibacter sp.]HZP10709.1 glutaminase A [Methyloceanibacter sp.]